MRIGVLKERAPGERRVALVPEGAAKLVKAGAEVWVEAGAGEAATFRDADYEAAGARVSSKAEDILKEASILLRVQRPSEEELAVLPEGAVVVSFMRAGQPYLDRLVARRLTGLAMERVPRTTRAQSMDALSSQATVAGYRAVLLGAEASPRLFPMLTTAAGTLTPAKVLVLGAGVAGLQAIATARRLGAVVTAFDVRAAAREQVLSLGAKFIDAEASREAEGQGGYAKEVGEDLQRRILDAVGKVIKDQDVVISTAQIPNKPAPRLITGDMVKVMKNGAVIVDVAAETGGNCELTRPGETVTVGGVTVMGPTNLPATAPFHSSQMYSRNLQSLLGLMLKDGQVKVDFADDILAAMAVTHAGQLRAA